VNKPRRRPLTAADAPSELQPGAQHAWRRYQASVQPLNKQPEPVPRCHCGADAAKRIVSKNTLNYGREFWGCARSKQRCKFFQWGDDGRPWDEMSSDARREAYFENLKKSLACQTVLRPEYKPENLNKNLTDILERMRAQYKASGDQFRVLGYTKAINAIKRCRRRIDSAEEARQLYGVGDRIAIKIDEIIRTGQLRQADHAADCEEGRTSELFSKVWGAGPATVRPLVCGRLPHSRRSVGARERVDARAAHRFAPLSKTSSCAFRAKRWVESSRLWRASASRTIPVSW
jgi:hypothetical protein